MKKLWTMAVLTAALTLSACGSKTQAPTASTESTTVEVVVVGEDQLTEDEPVVATEPEAPEPEPTFPDVPLDSDIYETVESALDKGLLEGFLKDDQFHPDEPLENADIPLLFWNLAGRPEAESSADIANLDELNEEEALAAQWYYGAYHGFMFTDGKTPEFVEPKESTKRATFSDAAFFAVERLGLDTNRESGEHAYLASSEEAAQELVTRREAIVALNTLSDKSPVGAEFVQELSDDTLALINPPASVEAEQKDVEVAQAEPAPAPAPAETPAETPAEAQAPAPPPAPTPEEIAAAEAAAKVQAEAEAKAAAEAAAAQAAAEAQAQAQAAAQAQAEAEARAAAEVAAAQAAVAQAAGNFLDPVWVRSQILSTAEANGFYCTEVSPGIEGEQRFAVKANDASWQNKFIFISFSPGQNHYHCVYGRSLTVPSMSSTINFYSVDEIKNFIASHAY